MTVLKNYPFVRKKTVCHLGSRQLLRFSSKVGTQSKQRERKDSHFILLDIEYTHELIFSISIRGLFRAKLTELQMYHDLNKGEL